MPIFISIYRWRQNRSYQTIEGIMRTRIHRPTTSALRKLVLQPLHRELNVSHPQRGIQIDRAQLDGVVLFRTLTAAEGTDVVDVKLLGLPRQQTFFDLLGKAVGIGGRAKCLTRNNPGGLVVPMAIAVGASKTRDDHVRA